MTWLFEEPWLIVSIGVAVEIFLGLLLLKTGRGGLLWVMAGVLVLTGVLLVVERLVVTEREQVFATLDGAARAVEKGDVEQVKGFLAPDANALQAHVANVLHRFSIKDAHIGGDLEIKLDMKTQPPVATAEFTARVQFIDHMAKLPYDKYATRLTVDLRKENGRWLVVEVATPQGGRPGSAGSGP